MLSGLLASMQNRANIFVNFQEQRSIQGIEFGKSFVFWLQRHSNCSGGSNLFSNGYDFQKTPITPN